MYLTSLGSGVCFFTCRPCWWLATTSITFGPCVPWREEGRGGGREGARGEETCPPVGGWRQPRPWVPYAEGGREEGGREGRREEKVSLS